MLHKIKNNGNDNDNDNRIECKGNNITITVFSLTSGIKKELVL